MTQVTKEDIQKLKKAPLDYAIMMEDRHLENVIVTFVSVLIKRKRGDQN